MNPAQSEIELIAGRETLSGIGSTADDVVLATYSYPKIAAVEHAAVERFIELLDGFAKSPNDKFTAMSAPRQMSMVSLSDSLASLSLHLVGPDSHVIAAKLRDAAAALLNKTATDEQIEDVRMCADSLGRVTFDRQMDHVARQGMPWTRTTSAFS
jgi:hypothetical protein